MPYPNPRDLMAGELRSFIGADAFGERLTIYTATFDGVHPDEGTPSWTADTTGTTVSGQVVAREQTQEHERTTGEEVRGEYYIYVPDDAPVFDGRLDEQQDSSVVEDEAGNRYEIQFVERQGNGLYRCIGDMEVGE